MNTATASLPTDHPEGPGNGDRLRARPGETPQGAFAAMLQGGATAQAILARIPVEFSLARPTRDAPEPADIDASDATPPADFRPDTDSAVTNHPAAEPIAEIPRDPDIPFPPPAETPVPAAPEASQQAPDTPQRPAITRPSTPAEPAAPHTVNSQEPPAAHRAPAHAEANAPSQVPAQANKPAQDPMPRLSAQVTERPAELQSRPGATLAASATVAAQTGVEKRSVPRPATGGSGTADTGPRLAGAMMRHAHAGGQTQTGQNQGESSFTQGGQGGQPATSNQQPPSAAAFGLMTAQTAAAGRTTAIPSAQTSVSAPGGEIGSANAADGPQAPYRAASQARFLRGRPPVPPQAMIRQVTVQIQKAVGQGVDRIQIQLKPADLGRVEIRLDVSADGRAAIMISADRQETLDLLQRDARSLQTALQDAGLQTDGESLKFSLHGGDTSGQGQTAATDQADISDESETQAASAGTQPQILSNDQIDITV